MAVYSAMRAVRRKFGKSNYEKKEGCLPAAKNYFMGQPPEDAFKLRRPPVAGDDDKAEQADAVAEVGVAVGRLRGRVAP
ncbi:hypothetical protein J6TS7_27390 [Paenibacillus dendritiformis]|nr:hypothetical protein J6TS7_27390 [Paenibacillus dendritiformis]